MTIRLHDGSGFEVKPGSNILVKQPMPDLIYLHWLSPTNQENRILANRIRQIES